METNYPITKISWEKYEELARTIIDQIRNYNIDFVIPVLRGGSVLGMTIASNLNIQTCYIRVKRSISNKVNSDFGKPEFIGEIGLTEIKDKVVLVCEDTIDTEITIKEVIRNLQLFHPKRIIIATLFNYSNNNEYICGYKADSHFWVVFPWEKNFYE